MSLDVVQHAYLVPDVFVAAEHWARALGAGPFFVMEHIPLENVIHRGEPGSLDHSSAYGQLGDTMVELVQQNCASPSVFTGFPPALHHLAAFAPDLDAALDGLAGTGVETAMTAEAGGGQRFAFADARELAGHYIELYQDGPAVRGFYAFVRSAAQDWDGSDPVRSLLDR